MVNRRPTVSTASQCSNSGRTTHTRSKRKCRSSVSGRPPLAVAITGAYDLGAFTCVVGVGENASALLAPIPRAHPAHGLWIDSDSSSDRAYRQGSGGECLSQTLVLLTRERGFGTPHHSYNGPKPSVFAVEACQGTAAV
jgi:hypothetical protein